jgi:hypothetical protein
LGIIDWLVSAWQIRARGGYALAAARLSAAVCVALLLQPFGSARADDPYIGPAWSKKMTFSVYENRFVSVDENRLGGPASGSREVTEVTAVYAVGQIVAGSADDLEAFLDRNAVKPGVTVFLHSPGGDVDEGLAIGRLFRKRLLRTNIGQVSHLQRPLGGPYQQFGPNEPGVCASACSMAFLGGVQRSVMDGSLYAIHDTRVQDPARLQNPFAAGQEVAASVAAYYAEMGVDPKLLVIANQYDSSVGQIAFVPPQLMASLRVTTPPLLTSWRIANYAHGQFDVVGTTPDQFGHLNKMLVECISGIQASMSFHVRITGKTILGGPIDQRDFAHDATVTQIADTAKQTTRAIAGPSPALIVPDQHEKSFVEYDKTDDEIFAAIWITPRIKDFLRTAGVLTFTLSAPPPPGTVMGIRPSQSFSFDLAPGRTMLQNMIVDCK